MGKGKGTNILNVRYLKFLFKTVKYFLEVGLKGILSSYFCWYLVFKPLRKWICNFYNIKNNKIKNFKDIFHKNINYPQVKQSIL